MAKRDYDFWVYILASRSRTLYVGMTNSLMHRTATHRNMVPGSFTARYGMFRLVYFEHHQYVLNAIAREKQLKKWTRAQKIALVQETNPTWEDLFQPFGQKIVPTLNGKQIPWGNDNQRGESENGVVFGQAVSTRPDEQRIPCGNDNQRDESKDGVVFGQAVVAGPDEQRIRFGNDNQFADAKTSNVTTSVLRNEGQ